MSKEINIIKSNAITSGSVTLYTVPAGKVFYIYSVSWHIGTVGTQHRFHVLDSTDTLKFYIYLMNSQAAGEARSFNYYGFSVKLVEGDYFWLRRIAGTPEGSVTIMGCEEDA